MVSEIAFCFGSATTTCLPRAARCRSAVAQAEAQLAAGRTQQLTAESNLTTTRSNFRRIIGNEPEALAPGSPVDRFFPGSLPASVELSLIENPQVTGAMFGVDVNYLNVKISDFAGGSQSLQAVVGGSADVVSGV